MVEIRKKEANGIKAKIPPAVQECITKLRSELDLKMSDDLHVSIILKEALLEAFKSMNNSMKLLQVETVKALKNFVQIYTHVYIYRNICMYLLLRSSFSEIIAEKAEATAIISCSVPHRVRERSKGSSGNPWNANE